MGICRIVAAGELGAARIERGPGDILIAADAGIRYIEDAGLSPDIAVGDFDSLGRVPDCHEVIKHPVMKDDTDTMLAIKTGFERGYSDFMVYGALGGRLDHTIANIQSLSYIARRGARGIINGGDTCLAAVRGAEMRFTADAFGTVSFFATDGRAEDVTLRGFLYELNGAVLEPSFPLGTSNEFIGKQAVARVGNGTLLAVFKRMEFFII